MPDDIRERNRIDRNRAAIRLLVARVRAHQTSAHSGDDTDCVGDAAMLVIATASHAQLCHLAIMLASALAKHPPSDMDTTLDAMAAQLAELDDTDPTDGVTP